MDVTVIFDIGKTHKKFLLFDDQLNIISEHTHKTGELRDDDGDLCDDLRAITSWVRSGLDTVMKSKDFTVKKLNFSTYGASLVHLDGNDRAVTPLYNYLKPLPTTIEDDFYKRYGPREVFSSQVSSPALGMLNSGLQLYWLKQVKPRVYDSIKTSLHLPNYMAYLFHGKKVAELTSIGCHTALWSFQSNGYHPWVQEERVNTKLPAIVNTCTTFPYTGDPAIQVGVGIHDSSAALIPYLVQSQDPFILLSTGTWNIALNPFNDNLLGPLDLEKDSLHYFSFEGKPVMANRLFLGNEHDVWNRKLSEYFNKSITYHRSILPDESIIRHLMDRKGCWSHFDLAKYHKCQNSLSPLGDEVEPTDFTSYEEAYHDLVLKLAACQVQSIGNVQGEVPIENIFITGGFIENRIFTWLLARHFTGKRVFTTSLQRASALGAALVMGNTKEQKPVELFVARPIET